jgi:hypothetical protein
MELNTKFTDEYNKWMESEKTRAGHQETPYVIPLSLNGTEIQNSTIFKCHTCNQKIRIPINNRLLKTSCKACNCLFVFQCGEIISANNDGVEQIIDSSPYQSPTTTTTWGKMNIKKTIQRKLNKKLGVWLIYIGVAMPFVLFPLTSLSTNDINLTMGYANARMRYDAPLLNREIVFFAEDVEGLKTVINYSTVIFLGLLLSFLGGGIIIYSYNKKD